MGARPRVAEHTVFAVSQKAAVFRVHNKGMELKHRTTEVPKALGSERPKLLTAEQARAFETSPLQLFAAEVPRDLHMHDFDTLVGEDDGVMRVWIELYDMAAEHTVFVTARYDREFGCLEDICVDDAWLPLGHPARTRVEHDQMVLGAAERHTAFEREAALCALYDL